MKLIFFLNVKKKSGMVGVEIASIPLDMASRPKVKKLIKIKMPHIPRVFDVNSPSKIKNTNFNAGLKNMTKLVRI